MLQILTACLLMQLLHTQELIQRIDILSKHADHPDMRM